MEKQLLDFINKYFGVASVGDTPENKGQCVGLIEVWLDILGLNNPHLYGNAKDLFANADPQKFTKIKNNPNDYNQFPPSGAVMVFDSSWGGGFGHTGVIIRANGYSFTLFEQNNPTGVRPTISNFRSYSGVIGWFFPKQ